MSRAVRCAECRLGVCTARSTTASHSLQQPLCTACRRPARRTSSRAAIRPRESNRTIVVDLRRPGAASVAPRHEGIIGSYRPPAARRPATCCIDHEQCRYSWRSTNRSTRATSGPAANSAGDGEPHPVYRDDAFTDRPNVAAGESRRSSENGAGRVVPERQPLLINLPAGRRPAPDDGYSSGSPDRSASGPEGSPRAPDYRWANQEFMTQRPTPAV